MDLAIEDLGLRDSAEKLRQWLRGLGVLQDFSRPKIPEDLAILERFMRTVKEEEVYPGEYIDQYEDRDGIERFMITTIIVVHTSYWTM